MRIKVYVEGGGNCNRRLSAECRSAFAALFDKAGLAGRKPSVHPSGGRQQAYDDFCIALRNASATEFPVLLVDSESPVSSEPWQHVESRDGDNWKRPQDAADDQLHLMVQVMESWFLADRQKLAQYFLANFHKNRLPNTADLEDCPKQTVFDCLEDATKDTKKGRYGKGRGSFKILALLDPAKIENASLHAKRFFDVLRKRTA